jgi:O-antigen/teichoic acid export membrane protein
MTSAPSPRRVRPFGNRWWSPRWRSDLVAVLVGNSVGRLLGFIYLIVAARVLLPAEFGTLTIAIASGLLWVQVTATGFPQALTRLLSLPTPEARADVATALLLSAVVATGGLALVTALTAIQGGAPVVEVTAILAGLSVDAIYFATIRGLQDIYRLAVYRLASNAFQLIFLVVAVILGRMDALMGALIWGLSYLVPIVFWELSHPTRLGPLRRPTLGAARRQIEFAVPVTVGGLGYALLLNASVIVLGWSWPMEVVGHFGVVRTLSNILVLVPFGTSTLVMPLVARRAAAGVDVRGLVWRAALSVAAINAALIGLLFGGLPHIVAAIGGQYTDIGPALLGQSVGMEFYGISSVFIQSLIGLDKARVAALCTTAAGCLNFALAGAIIPAGGDVAAGAIFAVTAASLLACVAGAFWEWAPRPRLIEEREGAA